MTEIIRKKLNDSKAARWTALIIVSFTMMCGYFITDVMAPLEDLLMRTYNWSGTEYGLFTSAYGWFNVFLLMLILGGIILDKMGIRFTGKMACLLMLTGALIKAYAVSSYFTMTGTIFGVNAQVMIAGLGFAIFGMGVEIAGITVSKVIVKWFTGHELALAMGLQVALARIGTACALGFSLPLAKHFGAISAPVLIGALLLCIGTLSFFVYAVMDKKLDESIESSLDGEKEEGFKLSDIKMIVTNKGFWLIAFLCVLFYSGVFPFLKFATKIMIYKYGVEEGLAGYIPSLLPFGTILLTPLFGSLYDRIGKGATLMLIGSFMLIVVHGLFALPILNVWWFATIIMIVLGIAFSLVPSAMWPSVPKIIPQKQLGTAYSLIFYVQNWGLMGVPFIIGLVIDKYAMTTLPDGTVTYDYTIPMLIFTLFGVLAVIVALMLKAEDKKKGYGLELPNIKKN
ncbi:MFS family permease [Parabacteroides sp. PFB2-10]|uniref:MFS transporter n=1 Tax=Parabacteroides sp. PFB2-10 TaxID=1742405 RepID=UPI0024746C33|nr:MFS transporter [Parabacteroides sp. PFB2-10]MDH6312121.1 MFS family permease [Parabacteroides sp. PFB2-10]MDL2244605.1 MFS transporter [Parabacteroides sp. OttesenSCG-928-J18]